jgi:photosystem II stability/assembly factor-like uncharacterized protein
MYRYEYLLLATSHGLAICKSTPDGWQETSRALSDSFVTSVVAWDEVILVGTKDGIYCSQDSGATWVSKNDGLSIPHIRWLAKQSDGSQRVFAGTEPAAIFLSYDRGLTWKSRPEVESLREKHKWYLPYSPEAGCVRGFAFHGARGYASVEVGGVLRSDDFGETWDSATADQPNKAEIHSDVHSIEVHLSSADLVAAPTGGGFFISSDGGDSWEKRYRNCYCRAVWWDPIDLDHMILGVADWVDRNGRIEETRDGGLTWRDASGGLEVPWDRHMVERFGQVDDRLLAVLSNGNILERIPDSETWHSILPKAGRVHAVAGFGLGG